MPDAEKTIKITIRTNTRMAAIKALYSSEINEKTDISKSPSELSLEILDYYQKTEEKLRLDKEFLLSLIKGVYDNQSELDTIAAANIGKTWTLERLGAVMRCILRTAIYEILNFEDIPLKVIINEYVNITRSFFDEKEVGFVNGILDKIAHETRDES